MESTLTSTLLANGPASSRALYLTLIFTSIIALTSLTLHIRRDYAAFLALGPGGTPQTTTGYLKIKLLSLFALRNPYTSPSISSHTPSYLTTLPERQGPRPETRGIAPHRQTTQTPSPAIYTHLTTALQTLCTASRASVTMGTSCFESHSPALFSLSPARRTCAGEICHAHPSDRGSMHLTLAPGDVAKVLEARWGERHPLARGGWWERFVPAGFVLVYAPRDEGEVEVVVGVARAAAAFVGGGDEERDGKGEGEERRDSGYASADD